MLSNGFVEQSAIFRLADRFQNKRRVCRRILGRVSPHGMEITGVGYDRGPAPQ